MIKLKYKSWEEVTIPVYQELTAIAQDNDGAFDEREIDILAVLCDSDRESLKNLLLDDYALLARDAQFLQRIPHYTPPSKMILRGVEYRVMVDISKYTLAQYTEYNALRADAKMNIARLIATMLVPTSAKCYADGYDVGEVVEAIEAELPYYKAYGILHFFQLAQGLSAVGSLRLQARAMRRMARKVKDKEEKMMLREQAKRLRKASTSLGLCLLRQ